VREAAAGTILWRMKETFSGGRLGKRPRRSKAAWLEIVQSWRRSGQTAGQYAQRHGLHAGTLAVWGTKLRSELTAATEPVSEGTVAGFLPVRVVGAQARTDAQRESAELEVVLRNGRRVLVRGDVGSDTLRRLLDLAEGGVAC
jgi:transposase